MSLLVPDKVLRQAQQERPLRDHLAPARLLVVGPRSCSLSVYLGSSLVPDELLTYFFATGTIRSSSVPHELGGVL